MKTFLLIFITFLSTLSAADSNVDKKGLALKGYDPTSYFSKDGLRKGQSKFKTQHQGETYYFASQTNLDLFLKTPQKYRPQLGGWCAYAMLEGKAVNINPKSFKIVDQKLYLFHDGIWGDTLKRWNALIEKGDSENQMIEKVQNHWKKL